MFWACDECSCFGADIIEDSYIGTDKKAWLTFSKLSIVSCLTSSDLIRRLVSCFKLFSWALSSSTSCLDSSITSYLSLALSLGHMLPTGKLWCFSVLSGCSSTFFSEICFSETVHSESCLTGELKSIYVSSKFAFFWRVENSPALFMNCYGVNNLCFKGFSKNSFLADLSMSRLRSRSLNLGLVAYST